MHTRTGRALGPVALSIRSRCWTESTIRIGGLSLSRRPSSASAPRSAVGYAINRSSNPCSWSQSDSGSVNVISPWKPGSPSRISASSGRQRTDLLATRIGFPAARPSISLAFDQSASISTNANGASTSAKMSSSSS